IADRVNGVPNPGQHFLDRGLDVPLGCRHGVQLLTMTAPAWAGDALPESWAGTARPAAVRGDMVASGAYRLRKPSPICARRTRSRASLIAVSPRWVPLG